MTNKSKQKKNLKVIQINVDRSQEETISTIQYAADNKFDLILIQEPPAIKKDNQFELTIPKKYRVIMSKSPDDKPKAAVIVVNPSLKVRSDDSMNSQHIAVATLSANNTKMIVVSAYFNKNPAIYKQDEEQATKSEIELRLLNKDIDRLSEVLDKYSEFEQVIGVDANSRAVYFGEKQEDEDERGRTMVDYIMNKQMILANRKKKPTFEKWIEKNGRPVHCKSFIDLTLTNSTKVKIEDWTLHETAHTGHKKITFTVSADSNQFEQNRPSTRIYNLPKMDRRKFFQSYHKRKPTLMGIQQESRTDLERIAQQFVQAITVSMDESTPKLNAARASGYDWYSDDLKKDKKDLTKLRRQVNKAKSEIERERLKKELRERSKANRDRRRAASNQHYEKKKKVPRSVNEFWKIFKQLKSTRRDCESVLVDRDGKQLTSEREREAHIMKHLTGDQARDEMPVRDEVGKFDEIGKEEIESESANLPNNKAPGPDAIQNELLKLIIKEDREYVRHLFNLMLHNIYFPRCWKIGQYVLFAKDGKPKDRIESYRPISLLSTIGKLFERLLMKRLMDRIEEELNTVNQFGFMKGRSTITAAEKLIKKMKAVKKKKKLGIVIAIDIKGAFDNLKWSQIMSSLRKMGVESEYFQLVSELLIGRTMRYGETSAELTKGCPQGGTASPLLWNIGIYELLKKLSKIDDQMTVAFADDLTLLIEGTFKRDITRTYQAMKRILMNWCRMAGLEVSIPKTTIMQFAGASLNLDDLTLYGKKIERVDHFRYLGIVIDRELNFKKHVEYIAKKASKALNGIIWFIRSNRTISYNEKMIVYKSVLVPLMTYGAEIWHEPLRFEVHKAKIRRVQRMFLIGATRAYRTTSYEKIYQITGQIAIDLEVYYKLLCHRKKLEKNGPITEEERGEYRAILRDEHNKEFGKKLKIEIADERSWNEMICPEMVYVATGHGPLGGHLHMLNIMNDKTCRLCLEDDEVVEHFQNGCPALEYKIHRELKNKDDVSEFRERCRDLIGRLRQANDERPW